LLSVELEKRPFYLPLCSDDKGKGQVGEVKLHPFGNLKRKNTLSDFESAELCWYFDSHKNYAWIKFSTFGNAVSLELTKG